ncbi:hypothetical protein EH228_13200 [Erwinia endophytica]|uniref:hypothetical protein n=1 Tax=Erwinia endophytica TaxID=1563158 RepID=UPI001265F27D|nr:hypothetical protein EH228_13200 [Erwinia endophytica]
MKFFLFILATAVSFHSYANECKPGETLIASCNLSGKVIRIAAFCANEKNDTIRYTFSKGNTSELNVNFDTKNKLKRWIDLGTYTTYLGFNHGRYSYVLRIPEEKPGAVALLDVKENGNIISTKRCDSNSFGEKNIKMNSIEDIADSSVRNSGFKFP